MACLDLNMPGMRQYVNAALHKLFRTTLCATFTSRNFPEFTVFAICPRHGVYDTTTRYTLYTPACLLQHFYRKTTRWRPCGPKEGAGVQTEQGLGARAHKDPRRLCLV